MAEDGKVPTGLSIWNAMRQELTLNLYPLPFTTLPPAIFYVYLHPDDFDRIEGIVPRLVAELQQALSDEVRKINQGRAKSGGVLSRLIAREEAPPIEAPPGGWEVHVTADRNGTLEPGQLGIDSMLPLPPPLEFGGPPTTRIVKSVVSDAGRSSTTIEVPQSVALPEATAPDLRERAMLTYDDEQGHHAFSMCKDTLSVGRGGSSVWVDVQVFASPRVSREHFRLRRDRTGLFFIQDASSWGTSVDGEPIPAAVKGADGVLRPGAERAVVSPSRIDLAGALTIHFEARSLR
ncbi:MAG TPA: FHA domain-containing protein [Vicinamibacterales bacterium]|nr:FHA domain-containing protein [Vicinamibacterales bacterium]